MKILKIVLKDAVMDEIIMKNPAEGIKALKEVNAKAAETYHRVSLSKLKFLSPAQKRQIKISVFKHCL